MQGRGGAQGREHGLLARSRRVRTQELERDHERRRPSSGTAANDDESKEKMKESVEDLTTELVDVIRERGGNQMRQARRRDATTMAEN